MSKHNFFADHPEFGDAGRAIIISMPGGKWAIAAPWFAEARPGDVGGVTEFSAPEYMVLREFGSRDEAHTDWKRMAGI